MHYNAASITPTFQPCISPIWYQYKWLQCMSYRRYVSYFLWWVFTSKANGNDLNWGSDRRGRSFRKK